MPTIKVEIDGETHEIEPDQMELPEDVELVTPDHVPDGLYTEDALQQKIQDRLKNTKENTKEELLEDQDFHKQVFEQYGVTLDDNGQPKNIGDDFDPEEWKKKKADEITKPLKEEMEQIQETNKKLRHEKKKADILKAGQGLFKDQFLKSYAGSDDPFVVKQFADMFTVDPDTGQTVLEGEDGSPAVDGNGQRITPDQYFEQNKDQFKDLMADKRQESSGFNQGDDQGGVKKTFTRKEIENMDENEYAENREAILKAEKEGRIKE